MDGAICGIARVDVRDRRVGVRFVPPSLRREVHALRAAPRALPGGVDERMPVAVPNRAQRALREAVAELAAHHERLELAHADKPELPRQRNCLLARREAAGEHHDATGTVLALRAENRVPRPRGGVLEAGADRLRVACGHSVQLVRARRMSQCAGELRAVAPAHPEDDVLVHALAQVAAFHPHGVSPHSIRMACFDVSNRGAKSPSSPMREAR